MCAAAGIVLALLPDMVAALLGGVLHLHAGRWLGRALQRGLLLLTVALSLSRTAALVLNYGAPMSIYRALPPVRPSAVMLPFSAADEVCGLRRR